MEAVILAGGRGHRLGALTAKKQKGVLLYKGKPILAHVLENILRLQDIERVWIATGYRGEDVFKVLTKNYAALLATRNILTVSAPHLRGELTRLAYVAQMMPKPKDCIVTGIDTILPQIAFERLIEHTQTSTNKTVTFVASPRLSIANTHRLMHIQDGVVKSYQNPDSVPPRERSSLYIDTGTRYFPAHIMEQIRRMVVPQDVNPDGLFEELLKRGEPVEGIIFEEPWQHFATAMDFLK